MPINRKNMTDEEVRAYYAAAKQRSRQKKIADGKCMVCGVSPVIPGTNAQTNKPFKTCRECNISAHSRNIPRRQNFQIVKSLVRDGFTVAQIIEQTKFPREYVVELIEKGGWNG
jgi:hypothetical protein